MATNEVHMVYPEVERFADTFGDIGDLLSKVNRVLETLVNILKATAFIGAVGGGAVIAFIETIRPHIERVGKQCEELDRDLKASVAAFRRGDELGATRFH
jgi:hypothetical protein